MNDYKNVIKEIKKIRRMLLDYIKNSRINKFLKEYAIFTLVIGIVFTILITLCFGLWAFQITNPFAETIRIGEKVEINVNTGDVLIDTNAKICIKDYCIDNNGTATISGYSNSETST